MCTVSRIDQDLSRKMARHERSAGGALPSASDPTGAPYLGLTAQLHLVLAQRGDGATSVPFMRRALRPTSFDPPGRMERG